MCKSCEQYFCNYCALSWIQRAKSHKDCPCCRGYGVSTLLHKDEELFFNYPIPNIVKKLLSKVKLQCINKNHGCDEAITYDFLQQHESACGFQLVACPNANCNKQMLKMELVQHQKLCLFERINCPLCTNKVQRQHMDTHMQLCDYRLVECLHCV